MKKIITYIFTVPACILFYIAEKIRGEKISWRFEEALFSLDMNCSKCGHKGKIIKKKEAWTNHKGGK